MPSQLTFVIIGLGSRGFSADIAIIATQDKQHYGHAMAALKKGCHLLLEKPISPERRRGSRRHSGKRSAFCI